MPYLFLTLLLVALLLLRFNPKRADVRWLVFFLLSWSAGSLRYFIEQEISPSARTLAFWESLRGWLKLISDSTLPYAFVLFAVVYSDVARGRARTLWTAVLALPPIYVYYLTPPAEGLSSYPINSMYFIPYYVAGFVLIVRAWLKERDPTRKKERLAMAALVVPPVLVYAAFDNYVKTVTIVSYYRYVPLLLSATAFLIVFFLLASKQGVLGVRLILRKQLMDETRKGIASGTMMINHALKNRLTNIELLTKDALALSGEPGVDENLSLVLSETDRMKKLVLQIQKQVEDIRLTVTDCDVAVLARSAASVYQVALADKRIALNLDIPEGVGTHVRGDPIHLQEAISNLIRNAMEAMPPEGGNIGIRMYELPGELAVRISDDGPGIAEPDRSRIFEPFYSTKSNADNFGLGLSYCAAVMHKHNGTIEASGRPGEGTTFLLRLPARERRRTTRFFE